MKKPYPMSGGRVSPTDFLFSPIICFAADDGGGSGGAPNGGEAGGAGGGGGSPAAPYYPTGFDPQYQGADDRETIDKMSSQITSMRGEISKFGSIPKSSDEYDLGLSDDFLSSYGIEADDKGFGLFKEIAHKAGLRGDQSKVVGSFFEAAAEKGLIDKPISTEQMLSGLAPTGFSGTPEETQAAGSERFNKANNFIEVFAKNKELSSEATEMLSMMATDKGGLELVEMFMSNNPSVNPGGEGGGDVSQQTLNDRIADPRNQFGHEKYDPEFAKETQELFKKFHGE